MTELINNFTTMTDGEFGEFISRLSDEELDDIAVMRAAVVVNERDLPDVDGTVERREMLKNEWIRRGFSLDKFVIEWEGFLDTMDGGVAQQLRTAAGERAFRAAIAFDPFLSCFQTLDNFAEEEAKWLIDGLIPEGQITLLAADGGVGKTSLWCEIAAAISAGRGCFLDPPNTQRDPALVAFLTTEDSVRKKLKAKLRKSGAVMKNLITPDFARDTDGYLRDLKFGTDDMGDFIRRFRPRLCIFDPVQGFVPPEINMGTRNAMRDCLAPLVTLGEECGTTFLIICHTNKRKGAAGRDRIADSADLWDIARSVLMAGYTDKENVRYLSNEKNNYATLSPTRLFTLDDDGVPRPQGTTSKRDRDFMHIAAKASAPTTREACKARLLEILDDHDLEMKVKDLDAALQEEGFSYTSIRRAKEELKETGAIEFTCAGAREGRTFYVRKTEFSEPELYLPSDI